MVCWHVIFFGGGSEIRCLCHLLWSCPVIRSPWSSGNFNPNQQRQNKATDFDLPHAKNSNFPQQCHHAGNIGLKTSSFLLLSTRVCPRVWIRSIGDAWMSCSKEIRRQRKKQFYHLYSHIRIQIHEVQLFVCWYHYQDLDVHDCALSRFMIKKWWTVNQVLHKHLARAMSSPDEEGVFH